MSRTQTERLRAGYVTVRKGNRRPSATELIQGRRLAPAFSAALVFVIFALLFVWTNHQCVQMGYVIAGQHQEKSELNDLNRKYKVELANLTALDRLSYLAQGNLGLVTPKPDQVRVIE